MGPGKKGKRTATPAEVEEANVGVHLDGILQELPPPIAVIDISDHESLPEIYKKATDDIIQAMGKFSGIQFDFKEADGTHKCSVPVTPALDNSPNGAYVIEMTDGKKRLQLVAEKHQNWFRGIVTDSGGRYEIDGKTPKMLAGSSSLHTTSVYFDLLRNTVDRCNFGYHPFIDAFYTLVDYDPRVRNRKSHKIAVAVILVMLFEAPRFPELCDRSVQLLEDKEEELVGEPGRDLINDWGSTTCGDFFFENGDEMIVTLSSDTEESPVNKVAKSVRILCRTKWDAWVIENSKTAPKPPKWVPPNKKLAEGASSSSK